MRYAKTFGVKPKNKQQQEAITYLLDHSIDLVILDGVAGTGKTFISVACGLQMVLDERSYKEIVFTRSPVAVGNDMGFLPGTEEEKLGPWCGALRDSLEAMSISDDLTLDYVSSKIKIKAIQFMRGRSFFNKFIIIDETQNLSLSELKVLLTRSGENTKVVLLGDSTQIDTKKLNMNNNALTQIINFYNYCPVEYVKYVKLEQSERSRLCKWASEII